MKNLQYFPFERNHYYYGKFLSADDFYMEQKYMNDKHRFINRFLHGSGVIFGISVTAVDERMLAVQPGAALDFSGREIIIDKPLLLALSSIDGYHGDTHASSLYLCLEYDEYCHTESEKTEKNNNAEQYDSVTERYHFFLTETEPPSSEGMVRQFYQHTECVYHSDVCTITQTLPVMAKTGSTIPLLVKVQRHMRNAAVHFSYQLRLVGLKHGDARTITVSYDSRKQPMQGDEIVLRYDLDVLLHGDGETGSVETDRASFTMGRSDFSEGQFSPCRMNTEIVIGSYEQQLLRKFRSEGMQYILNESIRQPAICLAKLYVEEEDGRHRILGVEKMPFQQYVFSSLTAELLDMLRAERAQEQNAFLYSSPLNAKSEGEKMREQYAVSSGITEIAMPMGGRMGQCFYSEPISHGLGIGQTSVTLGLITSDTETIYGDTQIFGSSKKNVRADLAAKLDMEKGTFIIGMRLTEPAVSTRVQIHWTAVHSHIAETADSTPRLLIKPSMMEICVMETVTFETVFENCPKQPVQWSVREGARGGIITGGGAYTAPNTPGVYQILARTAEGSQTLQASAFVVVRNL